jgi:predicted ArsR family transcriptional regulator
MICEQAETVKQLLPDAVRDYLKSIEEQVQEAIKQAATAQSEKLAGDVVRAAADEQIQQAIEKLVPAIVERQIKAEITRLIQAA